MREHTTQLRVRYDECDPMGFVHHSNYLRYFEIGRTELLRASGGRYRDMEDEGLLVVVARIDCRYRSPARYDDTLNIHTEIQKVTAAKIIHQYKVTRVNPEHIDSAPTPIVDAVVTLAVIDRNGKLQHVPQSLRLQYGEI